MSWLELRLGAPKISKWSRRSGWLWLVLLASGAPLGAFGQNRPGPITNPSGTTHYFGGGEFDSIPSALTSKVLVSEDDNPIALEGNPAEEEDFFSSFDAFLDSDKNLNDLHQSYMRALIPYDTYSTFYIQSLDTHQVRAFSLDGQLKVRKAMAQSLRNYLLVKGIPRFLATREDTKLIGERYAAVVGQTERLTTVNLKNAANTTEFTGGINFLLKTWVRYRNQSLTMEFNRYLRRKNSSIFSVKKKFREFTLGTYYHIDTHIVEPFYAESLSKNFNYQVGVLYYTHVRDPLASLRNYIRFTYSF
jgi:hypothetical protein